MLLEMVENEGVKVNVNGVPIDELVDETEVKLPSPMDVDEDSIGGLSNENNGLNVLHRFKDEFKDDMVGSGGTTNRSFTKCFVGDDFFCDLFGRCNIGV